MDKKKEFSISGDCIACKLCAFIAEPNIIMTEKKTADVVIQPRNNLELQNCIEAMENCPVEAIED